MIILWLTVIMACALHLLSGNNETLTFERIEKMKTANLTKYAVTIDNAYQIFDTKEEAEQVYALIGGTGGESDELSDTPFGSAFLLLASDLERITPWVDNECNLREYITMAYAELDNRVLDAHAKDAKQYPDGFPDIFDELFK